MEEVLKPKAKKKKTLSQMTSPVGLEAPLSSLKSKKGSKSSSKSDFTPPFQQLEKSTPDTITGTSVSSGDYRALRHKYLMLEEENLSLEKELGGVEAEIKNLEDDKLQLLDQLVVMEGLLDPSELKPRRM